MPIFRAPLHFTLIRPRLTLAQIQTLAADIATLQTTAGNAVISCRHQLEPAQVTIENMLEENKNQCSNAAVNKSFVGLMAKAEITLADDRIDLFSLALNGTNIAGDGVVAAANTTSGSPNLTGAANAFTNVNEGDAVTGTGIAANSRVLFKNSNTSLTLTANATATGSAVSLTFTAPIGATKFQDLAGVTMGEAANPYWTVLARPLVGETPDTNVNRWLLFPRAGFEGQVQASYGLTTQFSYKLTMTAFTDDLDFRVLRGSPALV
jgi:hypothetical protein